MTRNRGATYDLTLSTIWWVHVQRMVSGMARVNTATQKERVKGFAYVIGNGAHAATNLCSDNPKPKHAANVRVRQVVKHNRKPLAHGLQTCISLLRLRIGCRRVIGDGNLLVILRGPSELNDRVLSLLIIIAVVFSKWMPQAMRTQW